MTMIKILMSCLLCSLITNNKPSANAKIAKIEIHFVGFNLETDAHVNCESFEKDFSGQFKTKTILKHSTIKKFEVFLTMLKPLKDHSFPDTRTKILIYRNDGSKDCVCLSSSTIAIDGKSMSSNKEFIAFIKKLEIE